MSFYERVMKAINADFSPTDEQRKVIESKDPVTLVVAGAGSGKTATMSNRIAYHVAAGTVRPDEVLGLTFTRKAAGELEKRVESTLERLRSAGILKVSGRSALLRPNISTYNSFASDISSTYGLFVGQEPGARLITDAERWQLMMQIVQNADIPKEIVEEKSANSIVSASLRLADGLIDNAVSIEEARMFLCREREALAMLMADKTRFRGEPDISKAWRKLSLDPFDFRLACLPLVENYFAVKKKESLVEFSDQIATARKVVERYPEIGREISKNYRLVLFDEYQDTSVGQALFLRHCLGKPIEEVDRSVCAVGDPNQAIYGWRGASANALADFARDFGTSMGEHARHLTLSTSFRSDKAILDAANAVANSLESEGIEVSSLKARQGSGQGCVSVSRPLMRSDSFRSIAWRVRDVFNDTVQRGEKPEIAILCRAHAWVREVASSLEKLNIPYEIVGGESFIERPEVRTIRAALGVIANPRRNDHLLRLLHHVAVGSDDLRALHRRTVEHARRNSAPGLDARAERSLVETMMAIDSRPEGMSSEGYERVLFIKEILESLSSKVHMPIPDVLSYTVTLLGLDVVAATRGVGSQRVRTTLDSFISLGRSYSLDHPGCSLSDFLDWLDLVDKHERMGEGEVGADLIPDEAAEVHPGVVQIMTIHASKGLEWKHLVAVPEVTEKGFDEKKERFSSWLTNVQEFPYSLRLDHARLPHFLPSDHKDKREAGEALRKFFDEEIPRHENQERRRLAYVAFTRPTQELLLSSYAWKSEEEPPSLHIDAEKETSCCPQDGNHSFVPHEQKENPDIRELLGHSVYVKDMWDETHMTKLGELAREDWPEELRQWWGTCASAEHLQEAAPFLFSQEHISDTSKGTLSWPQDTLRKIEIPEGTLENERLHKAVSWLIEVRNKGTIPTPIKQPYVTATDVVFMSEDASEYVKQARRPIPSQPSRAARTGTNLHAKIAEAFNQTVTLDIDSYMFENNNSAEDSHLTDGEEKILFEAFEKSRWSLMRPLAIEQKLAVVVGGKIVRCTIDAVFDTSEHNDLPDITIVDWKTGIRPNKRDISSKELQLALYRLAWSTTHKVPLESIAACFVYLREPASRQEFFVQRLSKEEIVQRITKTLEKGDE